MLFFVVVQPVPGGFGLLFLCGFYGAQFSCVYLGRGKKEAEMMTKNPPQRNVINAQVCLSLAQGWVGNLGQ